MCMDLVTSYRILEMASVEEVKSIDRERWCGPVEVRAKTVDVMKGCD